MDTITHKLGIAVHIEPDRPIELSRLLANLSSLGDEYQKYSKEILGVTRKEASKLYVGSVSPGSIDIFLQPEFIELAAVGLAIATSAGPVDAAKAIFDFGNRIKFLLDTFHAEPDPEDVSISDCNNAINIAQSVVEAGGTQTINIVNIEGGFSPIISVDEKNARKVIKNANAAKAALELPAGERFNSQAMVWKTFDRSPAKTEGQRSPDKGIIEGIDPKPKAILFCDGEEGMKAEIINSAENPMQMIYYVDVEAVRVNEKIRAYRIVNFHGKEGLDE